MWYFAFGSNINKKVFEGRRRIKPAESVPAVLPGWRLAFSQPGLPYAEPAFAAVERVEEGGASDGAPAPEVHGVAHRITPAQVRRPARTGNRPHEPLPPAGRRRCARGGSRASSAPLPQWAYVLETEGGSGGKEKEGGHAYTVVEAEAVDYQGRQLGVLTLTVTPAIKARLKVCHPSGRTRACRAQPRACGPALGGHRRHATERRPRHAGRVQGRPALPSLRYMTLIRDGAKDYGLAPDYQAWLATLPHYRATAPGQKVGRVLFQAIAFTFIFPVWAGALPCCARAAPCGRRWVVSAWAGCAACLLTATAESACLADRPRRRLLPLLAPGLRVLRRVTGMKAAAEDDFAGRWQRRYTAFLFKTVLDLHELLRPVLGCGMA